MAEPDIEMGESGVGARIVFAPASPDLSPYLGGFYRYDTLVAPGVQHEEMFLPSWGHLRALLAGEDWSFRIGGKTFSPLPRLSIFGPTVHAGYAPVISGVLVGVSLAPRGWARFVRTNAARMADNIVPLETHWAKGTAMLWPRLVAAEAFDNQIAVIEDVLRHRLATTPDNPPEVAQIEALLLDPAIVSVDQALAATGMPAWKFTRFVRQHFGFPPKLLMRRARFMRTILKIREDMDKSWASLVDQAYSDQSHFIRDCRDFLGMTPGQFAARFQPLAHAAFEAREKALGTRHHLVADVADSEA